MSTMMQLFKDAGYSNLNELVPFQEYEPKKKIEVKSFNQTTGEIEWKELKGLFFKGTSSPESSYAVYLDNGSTFLCTGDHLFYEPASDSFIKAKDVKGTITGLSLTKEPVEIQVVPIKTEFPILDIAVADNYTYFSNGVVSHNSFGSQAKLFSEGLRKLNPYLSRFSTSLILINQVRAKIGGFSSYGPQETTSGGMAIPFYASWRARVSHGEDITDRTETIGNHIKVKNSKSKIGFPKRSADLELLYATGFSPDSEYLDFIIDLELVKKSGAWFSNDEWEFKGQGRDSLLKFLQANKPIFEKCKEQVNATFTQHSILDVKDAVDDDTKDELDTLEE